MVETARYTRIFMEDLDIGLGVKNIRLGDQSVRPLTQINLAKFLTVSKFVLPATAFSGQPVMQLATGLPGGRRIWGVTVKNLVALGATNGLTGYQVGDPTVLNRWSNTAFPLTVPFESDEGDFADASLMIYPVDTPLILSGEGGLFDGTGQVEVAVHTSLLRHPA